VRVCGLGNNGSDGYIGVAGPVAEVGWRWAEVVDEPPKAAMGVVPQLVVEEVGNGIDGDMTQYFQTVCWTRSRYS